MVNGKILLNGDIQSKRTTEAGMLCETNIEGLTREALRGLSKALVL